MNACFPVFNALRKDTTAVVALFSYISVLAEYLLPCLAIFSASTIPFIKGRIIQQINSFISIYGMALTIRPFCDLRIIFPTNEIIDCIARLKLMPQRHCGLLSLQKYGTISIIVNPSFLFFRQFQKRWTRQLFVLQKILSRAGRSQNLSGPDSLVHAHERSFGIFLRILASPKNSISCPQNCAFNASSFQKVVCRVQVQGTVSPVAESKWMNRPSLRGCMLLMQE